MDVIDLVTLIDQQAQMILYFPVSIFEFLYKIFLAEYWDINLRFLLFLPLTSRAMHVIKLFKFTYLILNWIVSFFF